MVYFGYVSNNVLVPTKIPYAGIFNNAKNDYSYRIWFHIKQRMDIVCIFEGIYVIYYYIAANKVL